MKRLLLCLPLLLFVAPCLISGAPVSPKNVLILVEGRSHLSNLAMGDGRQLANLMGHFNALTTIEGVDNYRPGMMNRFDVVFYIGFHADNRVPSTFSHDVMVSGKSIVWIHTGFIEFSSGNGVRKRFGFSSDRLDSTGAYTRIKAGGKAFTKDEPIINIVTIHDRNKVRILATAVSASTRSEIPYIIRSGNLIYFADSPFASAGPTDRYLLFADMLHDIMGEEHEESHSAMIRIEDVNPMEDPEHLRDMADILSSRGIPFLVGVSPFYVNPGEGIRVSLSDKPGVVDALKYMVRNGGTLVMHGVTHQYKGVTAADYEFWDEESNGPIREETEAGIARKLETGIQEFTRNGLYPLLWETPHYTASFAFYRTVPAFFSTAIEQRLAIENFDYSQFFPYLIRRDLFGQRLYPENLGYVPLDSDAVRNDGFINQLINSAKTNLNVRDGFASCFFHAFLEPALLERLVDSIQALGYFYIDVRDDVNRVRSNDHIILSGSQSYELAPNGRYLIESYFDPRGELLRRFESADRLEGDISKSIELKPGEVYVAELTEMKRYQPGFLEQISGNVKGIYDRVFSQEVTWNETRPVILWNQHALGAAYNDQASLASVIRSVNIPLDTIFVGDRIDVAAYNLAIVPYSFIDSLRDTDFDLLTGFVERGGNLITDTRNDLSVEFGIRFSDARLRVNEVLDNLFPEERITWSDAELVSKYDADRIEKTFCVDASTAFPLVIGTGYGKGRVIFIATRFDPHTQLGTSHYPYMLEYIRTYFHLGPVIRKEQLEVYFDPGFRHTQSIEYLVRQWLRLGIRYVHVAGWHEYPKYTYDYKRLIDVAHAHGILVYLWLEPPQVSQKFWQDHPGWREKNYLNEDVRPSWRYPVALTDSACVRAMTGEYRRLLLAHDWDGVNLAELYFEAGAGFRDPHLFTPMHPSARSEILRASGFDPRSLFDSTSSYYWRSNDKAKETVIRYRTQKLNTVYESLLAMIEEVGRDREGFDVIVTAMDSYGSPELREDIGVDLNHVIALQRRYGFHLQIEDPQSRWSESPERYMDIGSSFAERLGSSSSLYLDLNILAFRKPDSVNPFPTLAQTGTEAMHMVRFASLGAPNLCIYSESSVNPQDLRYFAYALATDVRYHIRGDDMTIISPHSFVLKLPAETEGILVNGVPMSPVRDNCYFLPAGKHIVHRGLDASESFSTHHIQPRIISFTGNILSASYGMREIEIHYESDRRAILSLNGEPTALMVDGQSYPCSPLTGDDCYSIVLPTGAHRATIITGDFVTYGVNLTSFWSTTAITLFGSVGVFSLVAMYLTTHVIRRRMISKRSPRP
jgi:uncharacterized protein YdaL